MLRNAIAKASLRNSNLRNANVKVVLEFPLSGSFELTDGVDCISQRSFKPAGSFAFDFIVAYVVCYN